MPKPRARRGNGSVGTSMHMVYIGPKKRKGKTYRSKRWQFCVRCHRWIRPGQYYHIGKSGKSRHIKRDCN